MFSVLACNSGKTNDDIVAKAQVYLKEQMKDPASFQVIESKILDTTMMSEFLQKKYSRDSSMCALLKDDTSYCNSAERWSKKIQDLKQDSIYFITVQFDYRAKNGFGALDKYQKGVNYYLGSKSFSIK
jgi:hypothetical protein